VNLDVEIVVRLCAALAAFALVASPALVAVWKKAAAWLSAKREASPAEVGLAEMRTVLDLAARLRDAGNAEGVELCQKLIDVMLTPEARPEPKPDTKPGTTP
jgi:hypothetical protein